MKSKYFLFLGLFGLFLSCSDAQKEAVPHTSIASEDTAPVFHASHEPKKQQAPFSDVVQVGNTYYLAGQIGMDHTTRELVDGGIEAETRQTLENIKAVLEHHGLQMTDVVKAMVVLDDISDFSAFNAIYTQYFPQKPARTTFAAEALARGAKIEIEVVAFKQN
ncbi:MAG: RidA family protein [Flavobacteriaceae bacterium]|nr:RidA family protein [Flavobacteriaceae bacterium]